MSSYYLHLFWLGLPIMVQREEAIPGEGCSSLWAPSPEAERRLLSSVIY